VTERLELDACADFFTTGDAEKLAYCASRRVVDARSRFGPVATVVDGGSPVEMRTNQRGPRCPGVQRLMVEGGGMVHTQFLTGQPRRRAAARRRALLRRRLRATRFVNDGRFPWNPSRRATLAEVAPDRRHGAAALALCVAVTEAEPAVV